MEEKYYFKKSSEYREEGKRRIKEYLSTVGAVSREVNEGLKEIEKRDHKEK